MGAEHTVAQAHGLAFDDLAITTRGNVSYAFWSDTGGLFGVVMNAQGKPTQPVKRLSERCAGGVAATVLTPGTIGVACLRPFDGSEVSGHAAWITLGAELQLKKTRVLGTAGRVSHGIDVAVMDDALAVVWQDATVDGASLLLWRGSDKANQSSDEPESLLLSSPQSSPAEPSLTWLGKRLWLMWSEASGDPRNHERRLVLSRGEGAPTVVTTVMHDDPTPRLRTLNGQLYMAFRDQRTRGRKPGLYVSRLSERGALLGERARLSRADAKAGPAIVPCFEGLLAVAPRTFGGGKFVGVNWVDASLTRTSQERQFYEDSRQFSLAAGACLNDHALLLVGEQGSLERPQVHLRAVGFRCL